MALLFWGDILTIVVYFLIIFGIGVWSICKTDRGSVKEFFLAGKSMPWWTVGLSLFVSNIGSEHFIGLAGTAAASGFAIIEYEWNAVPLLLLLGWVFLPIYRASGIYTMPEYLHRRFGGQRLRIYLSAITLAYNVFINIPIDLYSGALFLNQSFDWPLYVAVTVMVAIVSMYVLLGGLNTVMYTDAIQSFIMLIGSIILSILALIHVGGWNAALEKYKTVPESMYNASNGTFDKCGWPREDAFHIFRDPVNSDFPGPALFIRSSLISVFYWCSNQVIVQRALASKNVAHGKGGVVLAAYLKLLPFFMMIVPGIVSRALYQEEVGCMDAKKCMQVCGNPGGCTNLAYPMLVSRILPQGLRGIMLAVMMSAVISSLTSVLNSASSIFTLDIWRLIRKKSTNMELLIVGRLFIVVLCGVGILWIPLMQTQHSGQIFQYATGVAGYLTSPMCAVTILAVFWNGTNEKGAFWGVIISQQLGLCRFILDLIYPNPPCGISDDQRPIIVTHVHYLYVSVIQACMAFVLIIFISYLTGPVPPEQYVGLTFWTRNASTGVTNRNHGESVLGNCSAIELCEQDDPIIEEIIPEVGSGFPRHPLWIRLLYLICGNPHKTNDVLDEAPDHRVMVNNQTNSKLQALFINIMAVTSLCVLTLLYGFFY